MNRMKTDKTMMIIDSIWLVVIMIGLILAGQHQSIQEYIHFISLVIWYVGARFLATTWSKS